ncbi:MAG: diadenylate cyclase [Saccharofermentans sp.]|nr:diadenylate cyclase [Saccharofermentans sp.]
MSMSFIEQIIEFINELIASLDSGVLFFGSALDFVRYVIDIAFVSFLFYWLLVFLRQTRAWQLMKGILFILVFVLFCGLVGLDMVSYIFNRLLYVFAILFIVLFQPELRRVLETLGLRSSSISGFNFFRRNGDTDQAKLSSFIDEICVACKEMSKTYTGALILIERSTKLDELLSQENVVRLDSDVTSSMLTSIFYKGAPMHDGGLLIRDGRIIAARCHVPLSVTMHELSRAGTRHRAAVGASEMGDTVAVVVSEERGKTSIAVNGRLFEMNSAKELEANLAYLLGLEAQAPKKGLSKLLDKLTGSHKSDETSGNAMAQANVVVKESGATSSDFIIKTKAAEEERNSNKLGLGVRICFILISLICSLTMWLYIQINNNPVVSKTITVPITYSTEGMSENIEVSYPVKNVEIEVVGRQNTIDKLTADDIIAMIDYESISGDTGGVVELPVTVTSAEANIYFRVERQVPETVSVTIYSVS